MMSKSKSDVCAKFSQVSWHDAELLSVHILKNPEVRQYDLRLDLNVITGFSEGRVQTSGKTALFSDCRILRSDLDLLGVVCCSGAISAGVCYEDTIEFEERTRRKTPPLELPDYNGLDEYLGFLIEMINPGGEITIFARDFEML